MAVAVCPGSPNICNGLPVGPGKKPLVVITNPVLRAARPRQAKIHSSLNAWIAFGFLLLAMHDQFVPSLQP